MKSKTFGSIFLILWTICCIVNVAKNMEHYKIVDWIVILIVAAIPYIIYFAIKNKKQTSKPPKENNLNSVTTENTEKKNEKSKPICAVCKTKISKFARNQISDGFLCGMCNRICQNSPLVLTEAVTAAWEENHKRFQEFEESMVVKNLGSGFIFIDNTHQYAYISNQKKTKIEPVIFRFSEIEEYRIEKVGEKTITKSKGGIRRAVVGGALFGGVGAIVGANTAKTETKTTGGTPFLYIDLDFNGVKTTVYITNPPMKASQTLDNMMNL